MTDEIRVGVAGCGYWGPNLIRNFSMLPGCRLAAVCDMDEKRLDHIRSRYRDVTCFKDFGRMLSEGAIDALAVATPVYLHYEMASQALEAANRSQKSTG